MLPTLTFNLTFFYFFDIFELRSSIVATVATLPLLFSPNFTFRLLYYSHLTLLPFHLSYLFRHFSRLGLSFFK